MIILIMAHHIRNLHEVKLLLTYSRYTINTSSIYSANMTIADTTDNSPMNPNRMIESVATIYMPTSLLIVMVSSCISVYEFMMVITTTMEVTN